jgi:precorrin isomerase
MNTSTPLASEDAASQEPLDPRRDTRPWSRLEIPACLPSPMHVLIKSIVLHCHTAPSTDADTQILHTLFQQLVAAALAATISALRSKSCSDPPTTSDLSHLFGMLVESTNLHFQSRPRIMFSSQDAGMQSASAAARGIKQSFTRFIELLSTNEDRAENVSQAAMFLPDSDDNAETPLRFRYLDMMSRRVVALKQPGQRWVATIDGAPARLGEDGFDASVGPVLQFAAAAVAEAAHTGVSDFAEAKCVICFSCLYESPSDGSVSLNAREMKCAGRHTFHSQCARGWIVNHKRSTCPHCRHDFSQVIYYGISAALEHAVELNGTTSAVHWTKPPSQRVTALNMLALLPPETLLGGAMSSALLYSCFDSEAGIAYVALQSGKLCLAIEAMTKDDISRWCLKLVDAMKHAQDDSRRSIVATAIADVAESEEGRACFVGEGACEALVEALKAAVDDETRWSVASAIHKLAESEKGRACFVGGGACEALVEALKAAEDDRARGYAALAIRKLGKSEEGRACFVGEGACEALVEALKAAEDDEMRLSVASAIQKLAESEEGRACFVGGGACEALVEALKAAEDDETRWSVAMAIRMLGKSEEGRACFVGGGACEALVEALKAAEDDETRDSVAVAIRMLAESEEGRACFDAMDAVGVLKLFLSNHPLLPWLRSCSNKRMKLADGTECSD